jgi:Fe-S cluster assembly protein SufD
VFTGRVVVHPQAQHTDAQQSNRNLLLSRDAEADSRPQLEIHADDVKCAHGEATGQLDPEQLFYLRSRGLDEPRARGLLVYAFAADVLARMQLVPLRRQLAAELAGRWLPAETMEVLLP